MTLAVPFLRNLCFHVDFEVEICSWIGNVLLEDVSEFLILYTRHTAKTQYVNKLIVCLLTFCSRVHPKKQTDQRAKQLSTSSILFI